jgi:hypothetical protein
MTDDANQGSAQTRCIRLPAFDPQLPAAPDADAALGGASKWGISREKARKTS